MPRAHPALVRDDEEREYIVKQIAKGKSDREIARAIAWPVEEVAETRREYYPTGSLATAYLKARSLELARRVVQEANVAESIDILSRPNMKVLEPAVKGGQQVQFGVVTSVNPADLGGVKVAVGLNIGPPAASRALEEPPAASDTPDDLPWSVRGREISPIAPLMLAEAPQPVEIAQIRPEIAKAEEKAPCQPQMSAKVAPRPGKTTKSTPKSRIGAAKARSRK